MKKIVAMAVLAVGFLVSLSGCSEDVHTKPTVFGDNAETISYIKSLNSNIKEVAVVPCRANKKCDGTFLISLEAVRANLYGSKTDWLMAANSNYHISKDLFSGFPNKIYELKTSHISAAKDKYGKDTKATWAIFTVKGDEAAKIEWKGMDWLQYTKNFVELESYNSDGLQWLRDFRNEYGLLK